MKPKNIELHIEELVLEGLEGSDHRIIGEAVERELSRLFAEQGVPPSLENGGKIDNLDGGAFEMTPGSRAEVVGSRVARTVYGGLKR
jgi:hypothetical protein